MLRSKALRALRGTWGLVSGGTSTVRETRPVARFASSAMGGYTIIDHTYDAIVVGAGGAGVRAAIGLSEHGFNTA